VRACPDENSCFAPRFKPHPRGLAFETVDYFTTFTVASPDSERDPGISNACGTKFPAAPPALEITGGNLC
jgi:hypothetical protein